ncbi:hypothetical protein [Staphylococcus hominis]|uniref:hypothetical protein n=1 Tax=Staphylococcus hominis TaxID=1290 RepID=UPI001F55E90F|nr:hypothetical protein [Staphylococcus hominis]MCI2931349.1 hypothetical protein [Staphylococcus hominis]MEC5378980.1 hypothetical protein [Staphylococcus hominis]
MSNAFNIEFDYKTFAEVIRQVTKITGETELQQPIDYLNTYSDEKISVLVHEGECHVGM